MAKYIAVAGCLAAILSVSASAVAAMPVVTNGSFEDTTLTGKGTFAGNVLGWSGGSKLTFLNYPGTASKGGIPVYGPFPTVSPDGGNFIGMDGDPNYSSAIYQTISGLAVGDSYIVSFDQAAGQQTGYTGGTTERWRVSLGAQTELSDIYSLPQGGVGAWEQEALTFTATATSEVLSFLAVGTPSGQPPISFLDGVSITDVPEPSSLVALAAGMIAFAAVRHRRRA